MRFWQFEFIPRRCSLCRIQRFSRHDRHLAPGQFTGRWVDMRAMASLVPEAAIVLRSSAMGSPHHCVRLAPCRSCAKPEMMANNFS
jgi:hypothetical protein